MKQQKLWLSVATGVLISSALSSPALAGRDPLTEENRLPAWEDYGTKTVDFTNIAINYRSGRVKRGKWQDAQYFGDSEGTVPDGTPVSTFSLNSTTDGYDNASFEGRMVIDAKISSKGKLRTNHSTFGIYSSDPMFGTDTVAYSCTKVSGSRLKGVECETGVLVYGGDLLDFGWSGSQGILEFSIGNLEGWAWDQWENPADQLTRTEHILLDVGVFDLGGVSRVRTFNAVADGFAVVPVPAAVWLFGSGLVGLVGFAKRKRA